MSKAHKDGKLKSALKNIKLVSHNAKIENDSDDSVSSLNENQEQPPMESTDDSFRNTQTKKSNKFVDIQVEPPSNEEK